MLSWREDGQSKASMGGVRWATAHIWQSVFDSPGIVCFPGVVNPLHSALESGLHMRVPDKPPKPVRKQGGYHPVATISERGRCLDFKPQS